jgi:hypothetical protein
MTIGPALFCVSSPCEGGAFETVLPFSVVGRGGTSYVSGGQANFTVIGAPWTTATVQVGAETAHGSHATDSRPYWDIAPGFWFRTNLVTPVFISSSLNSYTISAIGRLDLVAFTPRCANGQDDDQDGLADFPDDPGCEHADDLDESLEYRDGASHVLDAAIAEGEDVDVWSLGETPTTLRIVAPAVVPAIVSVQYGGVLHMEGGAIGERIEVEDGGELVVTGGALDRILAMGGSVLVRGTGFDRPYGPILDTFGTLSGTLADGSPVTITLQCDAEATCAIPEPEGAALPAVVATAMLAGLRARASRARGRPRSQ